jgi:hypothetical protein
MINFAAYGKMEALFGAIVGTIVGVFMKSSAKTENFPPCFGMQV